MAAQSQTIKHFLANRFRESIKTFRGQWLEMIRADAPVLVLAGAFTVGTLVSMVPIPVVDMLLAGLVMRRLDRLPRGPIVVAMAFWNNLIMAPVYASCPRVGGMVIATTASHSHWQPADAVLLQIVVGSVAIVIGLTLFSFLLATALFTLLRRQPAIHA